MIVRSVARGETMLLVLVAAALSVSDATSIKMDYLPLTDVRLDPMSDEQCVSDHVHSFYGPSVAPRPNITHAQLRAATEGSGNVLENGSLYWHPTVYEVSVDAGGVPVEYRKAPIWFASSYYVWPTGETQAFPDGFKMVARGSEPMAQAEFECVGPSACERGRRDCDAALAGSNFPSSACWELEVSLVFPSCWDGRALDSADHMSHVAYTDDGYADGHCPASHPVRLPQIHWYFRIREYKGGRYELSDATSELHADYMSGWDAEQLQGVLDSCNNDSFSAEPDHFCEHFLTFRDGPKRGSKDDELIAEKLATLQPHASVVDPLALVPERIDLVRFLPRGNCSGILLPAGG